MKEAFLFDGIRTPIGRFRGSLSTIRADDLMAYVIGALVKRNPKVDWEKVDDVIVGCANQAGEDNRNVARMASLLAGLPETVPGETVNRLCASGLSSVVQAARAIRLGDGELYLAGGMEHMTRGPFVISKASAAFGRDAEFSDTSFGWRFVNKKMKEQFGTDAMGETAENLIEQFPVSREDQDAFSYWSQTKAQAAEKSGRFKKEIVSVEIPQRKKEPIIFSNDEFIRYDTSPEALAKLKPVFRTDGKGTVTAGNSSGLNDGAAALLVGSETAANQFSLKPVAKILSSAVVGVEPRIMGIGPLYATKKVLEKLNLSLEQMDVIEINEAFASQSLVCLRELGLEDQDPRVNPNGGAIALGHPLGMSGARLVLTAMRELEEKNKKYALVTMCVGLGQGMAAVLERV